MSKLDELIKKLCPNGVEYKTLGEIFDTRNGYTPSTKNSEFWENGTIPWFVMDDIRKNGHILAESNQHITESAIKKSGLFPANSLIIATSATIGEHALITKDFLCNQRFTCLSVKDEFKSKIDMRFMFYYAFKLDDFCIKNQTQSTFASVDMNKFYVFMFPLPPLPVQEEIVRILDTFTSLTAELTAELTARRKQYEYYRDELLTRETKVEVKKLGDIADIGVGNKPRQILEEKTEYEYINAGTTNSGYTSITNCEGDTVTTPSRGQGGIGFVGYQKNDFYLGPLCYKIRSFNTKLVMNKYLFYYLQNNNEKILKIKNTGGVPSVNRADLINISISFPPLDVQQRIVNVLDNFDAICTDLKIGLPAEIEARKKQYEYYRDMLLSFDTIHTNGGGRAEAMK